MNLSASPRLSWRTRSRGFRETKTARLVAGKFAEMGMQVRVGLALTGLRADLVGSSPGPALAVIGELDSLIVNEHPHANSETGAAHACGHHCQMGMIMGAAMALKQPEVLEHLSGRSGVHGGARRGIHRD